MGKDKISFSDFMEISDKLEIKIGIITSALRIPKKDKLLALKVSFGSGEPDKDCVTNLGEFYEPEDFIGNELPFVMNLEPSKMGGVVSEVMLMVSQLDSNIKIHMADFDIGGKLM